jgi:hypothetical protein
MVEICLKQGCTYYSGTFITGRTITGRFEPWDVADLPCNVKKSLRVMPLSSRESVMSLIKLFLAGNAKRISGFPGIFWTDFGQSILRQNYFLAKKSKILKKKYFRP